MYGADEKGHVLSFLFFAEACRNHEDRSQIRDLTAFCKLMQSIRSGAVTPRSDFRYSSSLLYGRKRVLKRTVIVRSRKPLSFGAFLFYDLYPHDRCRYFALIKALQVNKKHSKRAMDQILFGKSRVCTCIEKENAL